jgi:phosphatidylserine decarboxylase
MAVARLQRPLSRTLRPPHTLVAPQQCRTFIVSPIRSRPQNRKEKFGSRLGTALRGTRIEWYWIPATAGIAFLGGVQFYRVYTREQARKEEEDRASAYSDSDAEEWEEPEPGKKPKRRKRIRPSGPWYAALSSQVGVHFLTWQQADSNHVNTPAKRPLAALGKVQ